MNDMAKFIRYAFACSFLACVTLFAACGSKPPKKEITPTPSPSATHTSTPTPVVITPAPNEYTMTTLPVISIHTAGQRISEGDEYTNISISFQSPDGSYDKDFITAGIRVRGNASRNWPKKSYKIKLSEKKNLYGIAQGKEKKWVLISNHCDQSLLRNYAALSLQRSLSSIWTPNSISVELFIDGVYQGVYMLAEQIDISKDRVNIDDSQIDIADTSYLFEFSSYAEAPFFTINGNKYGIKSDLSQDPTIKNEQLTFIKNYLLDCRQALIKGDEEKARELMDIDSLVKAYLLEEFAKNQDSQWDSFYYYKEAGGKLYVGPAWDFDLAFGNDQRAGSGEESYKSLYVANGRGSVNGSGDATIFIIAMQNEWFRKRVQETWNANRDTFKNLAGDIRLYAATGKDCYQRNFVKWPIFGRRINQEPREVMNLKTYDAHITYLTHWMDMRYEWLNYTFNSEAFLDGTLIKKVNTNR